MVSTKSSVNIVIVIIGDSPAYGYYVQAPAYEASFESLRLTYPELLGKINRHTFHKPGLYSCAEAAAMMPVISGELDVLIRRLNGSTILISPGCSLEMMALGISPGMGRAIVGNVSMLIVRGYG